MLVAALFASLTVAAAEVRLSVQAGAPCSLDVGLEAALAGQSVRVVPAAPELLSVTWVEEHLVVTLLTSGGALRGTRALDVGPSDCEVLAQSIALLVRAWLDTPLAVPEPAPAAVRRNPPLRRAPPEVYSSEPSAPAAEPAPSSQPVEAEPVVEVPPPSEPPPPPEQVAVVAPPAAVPVRPSRTFTVAVTGGASFGLGDQGVAQVTGSLGFGFLEPWGVALDVGFDTPRRLLSIGVEQSWGGFSLRRAFFLRDTALSGLYVSLGARLVRLHAGNFEESREIFTGAFALGAEWRQVLVRGLFVSLGASAQARLRTETVTDLGIVNGVLTIPPFSFVFSGGAGWNFP